MLSCLARASNIQELAGSIPEALEILEKYVRLLRSGRAKLDDLIVRKQLSRYPDGYKHNVLQAIAAKQLKAEGVNVSAGQTVSYIITDAGNRQPENRVITLELSGSEVRYDVHKYVELLLSSAVNVLGPFGYNLDCLRESCGRSFSPHGYYV